MDKFQSLEKKMPITANLFNFAAINIHIFPMDSQFMAINLRVSLACLVDYNGSIKCSWQFIFYEDICLAITVKIKRSRNLIGLLYAYTRQFYNHASIGSILLKYFQRNSKALYGIINIIQSSVLDKKMSHDTTKCVFGVSDQARPQTGLHSHRS